MFFIAFKQFLYGFIFFLVTSTFDPVLAAPIMPWDSSLTVIQNALTGTTAHILIVIAIAISGLMWALGEQGSMIQKAGKIVCGGAIATGAVSISTALFNFI
jgi:type IV secretory pathway VirB2 component (pilin)